MSERVCRALYYGEPGCICDEIEAEMILGSKIESAERAIVEAADKWRDNLAYADRCELELAASVDAWRKLRDAR